VVNIDGSMGEGGGQVLRTSLSLSLVTGKPFTITNIRAGRQKPGLLRQHLTAVKAAAAVGDAEVAGAELGSTELTFTPATVRPGEYTFSIASAGSATLVLQTVLPPLLVADGPSHLTLEGGTHNPWAPPFCFLKRSFLPLVGLMGPSVTAKLEHHGFYPAGGGRFTVDIEPAPQLGTIDILERGALHRLSARCLLANLPIHISERELTMVKKKLNLAAEDASTEFVKDPRGPGNALIVEVETAALTELFIGFGERGVRAEAVADHVCKETRRYLKAKAPVGVYLADQLLIPMAMAGGGSFRTTGITQHTRTNVEVIRHFLDVDIAIKGPAGREEPTDDESDDEPAGEGWLVTVRPRSA